MKFIDSFLLATAMAYLGCLVFTLRGKPPMVSIKPWLQGLFYVFAFMIFTAAGLDVFPQYVYAVLGVVYGIASVGSFIGYPQIWAAYWKEHPYQGSDAGQIGMAFWDLAIAVFCFMKWTL